MGIGELFLLAVGLSMDAFAVSVCKGLAMKKATLKALLDGVFTPGEAVPSGGDGLLRKCAHFAEFGALGLLLGWLFGMLGKKRLPAFALGVAAACIDETIQVFVPGRSPGIRDVCIDSCGAAAGMLLLFLGHAYWKRRFTRKNSGGNET